MTDYFNNCPASLMEISFVIVIIFTIIIILIYK